MFISSFKCINLIKFRYSRDFKQKVAKAVKKYGVQKVHDTTSIPISNLVRWRDADFNAKEKRGLKPKYPQLEIAVLNFF